MLRRYLTCLFLLLLVVSYCSRNLPKIDKNKIIAKVGNRYITEDEFIRRAEYTPRPPYCRQNYYVHKKIILNTLIAEKLFALEEEKSNRSVLENENVRNYLIGRKEQAMRKWHYYLTAYSKVKLDTEEIKRYYKNSLREYKIEYFTFDDTVILNKAKKEIKTSEDFYRFFYANFKADSIPTINVKLDMISDPEVVKVLFFQEYGKGSVIGPIRTTEGKYIVMRVKGWVTRVPVTEKQKSAHWEDVERFLKLYKADSIYSVVVKGIMAGKEVVFNEIVFIAIARRLSDIYLNIKKKELFNSALWDVETRPALDTLSGIFDDISEEPFFTVDGKVWTVKEFKNLVSRHPLVFRKRRFKNREYLQQLKFAIVDLIRDYYITQDAYKRGYDKIESVRHYTDMWKDNLLAISHRGRLLQMRGVKNVLGSNYMPVLDTLLNPYFKNLADKYSDKIKINTDMLERINITRIDMSVLELSMPYPVVVPSFPILTSYDRIDYGRKIEK